MIFNLFNNKKKETFVLPLTGSDTAIKKYPLNDFENNFFYGFKETYPLYYAGLSFNRMSNGSIKFSYKTYPIGLVTRAGVLMIENDYRHKNPYKSFNDPLNHYDEIIKCIKRKYA